MTCVLLSSFEGDNGTSNKTQSLTDINFYNFSSYDLCTQLSSFEGDNGTSNNTKSLTDNNF